MREILFRAKRHKDYGEGWVYGVPFVDYAGDCIMKDNATERVVDSDTVGQYTGLTDKNGTKIFEGDIVSAHFDENYPENESRAIVEWGNFRWNTHQPGYDPDDVTKFDEDLWLVIGNIHDNPELLEVRHG